MSANVKRSVLEQLISKGLTAESATSDIKKAYFSITGNPLSKDNLTNVVLALKGDTSVVEDDSAAPAAEASAPKAKKEKAVKAPKEPKPAAAPKVAETPEAALARLKASTDPVIAGRWARVHEVLEMGKKGPTRVRIVCEDKGSNGETLYRDIKVQDLFQVKYSAGYKKSRAKATAPAAEATVTA
jgi:hypothetical protein